MLALEAEGHGYLNMRQPPYVEGGEGLQVLNVCLFPRLDL